MRRDRFITGGAEHQPVPGYKSGVQLHHIAYGFPAGEDQIHPVMALRAAVTEVGGMKSARYAAFFVYPSAYVFR